MIWLNIGCGTHRAPAPWVNTDVIANDWTHPDIRSNGALPFAAGSCERVYLGHLLEHVWWREVPALLAEVHRVLTDGGEVLAVGPDIYRTIRDWRDGRESWELVADVLEHADRLTDNWPEAVHKWNCHAQRLADALTAAGFHKVGETETFDDWPVVAWSAWQCAVRGVSCSR